MLGLLPTIKILDMEKITEESKQKTDFESATNKSTTNAPSKKDEDMGISADNLFKVNPGSGFPRSGRCA
jgi:hypothetical protein